MSQLSELVNVEGYAEWIRLVAEFTSKSLHSWQVQLEFLLCIPSSFGRCLLKLVFHYVPCAVDFISSGMS